MAIKAPNTVELNFVVTTHTDMSGEIIKYSGTYNNYWEALKEYQDEVLTEGKHGYITLVLETVINSEIVDTRTLADNYHEECHPFTDDLNKMYDFFMLSKYSMLTTYSYLTDEDYEATELMCQKTDVLDRLIKEVEDLKENPPHTPHTINDDELLKAIQYYKGSLVDNKN